MVVENFRFEIKRDIKQQIIVESLLQFELERYVVKGENGVEYLHTLCAVHLVESVRESFIKKGYLQPVIAVRGS